MLRRALQFTTAIVGIFGAFGCQGDRVIAPKPARSASRSPSDRSSAAGSRLTADVPSYIGAASDSVALALALTLKSQGFPELFNKLQAVQIRLQRGLDSVRAIDASKEATRRSGLAGAPLAMSDPPPPADLSEPPAIIDHVLTVSAGGDSGLVKVDVTVRGSTLHADLTQHRENLRAGTSTVPASQHFDIDTRTVFNCINSNFTNCSFTSSQSAAIKPPMDLPCEQRLTGSATSWATWDDASVSGLLSSWLGMLSQQRTSPTAYDSDQSNTSPTCIAPTAQITALGDNQVANSGGTLILQSSASASAQLNFSGRAGSAGLIDPTSFVWSTGGQNIGSGAQLTVTAPQGETVFTLTVTDVAGLIAKASVTVRVVQPPDKTPPTGTPDLPPLPPQPTVPQGFPTITCHTYRDEIDWDDGTISIISAPYTFCDANSATVQAAAVPVAVPVALGSFSSLNTTNTAVATMSSSGVLTAVGAGAAYRVESNGTQLRATPTYVKSPQTPANFTNGGCSDGWAYQALQGSPNGAWWYLGQTCLGDGTPTSSSAVASAPPRTLVAINQATSAIQPNVQLTWNQCNANTPTVCSFQLQGDGRDVIDLSIRGENYICAGRMLVGGAQSNSAAWPVHIKAWVNGTLTFDGTAPDPTHMPDVCGFNLQDLVPGANAVVSATITDTYGVTLTAATWLPIYSPDPAAPLSLEGQRALREWARANHRIPTSDDIKRISALHPRSPVKP